MHVVLVSCGPCASAAGATVTAALRWADAAHVLDLDASLPPGTTAEVLRPGDLGVDDLRARAAHQRLDDVARDLLPRMVTYVARGLDPDEAVLAIEPGVLLLDDPRELVAVARAEGLAVPATGVGIARPPLVAVRAGAVADLGAWRDAVEHGSAVPGTALVLGPATLTPHREVTDAGGLAVDGEPVVALDLSRLDPAMPWLLDAETPDSPGTRLSDHPALARRVAAEVARWPAPTQPELDLTRTVLDTPVDDALRTLHRAAGTTAPDLYSDPDRLLAWLREPTDGVPRWLLGLHRTRPDLRAAFAEVPGRDAPGLVAWAATHANAEGYRADLVPDTPAQDRRTARSMVAGAWRRARGLAGPKPAPGVTVVGFLRGELGIGESARQLVAALEAAGVPCGTVAVDPDGGTRARSPLAPAGDGRIREITVLAVNADLTPGVAASVPQHLTRSHRVGMWYWEVEDFPPSQHAGFAALDEIWVATDFVRRAIEPHSTVPVHTLTPPLPQRGADPSLGRTELGLPGGRPVLLFSFDFLSTAERKNPWGLIDAFSRAFAPNEGPVLVVKSINADRRPADAERLRVAALRRPDVLLREDYLDAGARDALVAHCDAYVSLHRSEGLGLTMAEAMAWGKPVIATGYSGNLQFMTEENSFLVPWSPALVPDDAPPYPPGSRWADPDLDEAARLMRLVVEQPAVAAARGGRAAQEIATLHGTSTAGSRFAARIAAIHADRSR